jgi:hypothetical protein
LGVVFCSENQRISPIRHENYIKKKTKELISSQHSHFTAKQIPLQWDFVPETDELISSMNSSSGNLWRHWGFESNQ